MGGGRYCLVAGSGDLVNQIVAGAQAGGLDLRIMSMVGPLDFPGVEVFECDPVDLDDVFGRIRAVGSDFVILAGYIRPETWDALYRYPRFGFGGVHAGVAALARRLEAEFPSLTGAPLVGINEVAPEMIAPDGLVAGPAVEGEAAERAASALAMARELGKRDQGQAVVLGPDGTVEAEDVRGTDALLSRVAQRDGRADGPWVLAKALKPGQPVTMDLPVIGPGTIESARKAGVGIVALEAGGVLIVNRAKVEAAARDAGISVVGMRF